MTWSKKKKPSQSNKEKILQQQNLPLLHVVQNKLLVFGLREILICVEYNNITQ